MVSSTFTDLEQHRAALIRAIKGQGLSDVAMENDSAKPGVDVIQSSLQMVRDASAYVGVISRKYGQTPPCPERNPRKLSLMELEFNEAQRLKRPILLFIMGDKHLVREADIETNPANRRKLKAFRERAKRAKADSPVPRVYAVFDSLEEFSTKAFQAVAGLRRYLDERSAPSTPQQIAATTAASHAPEPDPIPAPPAFYAEPAYIGSHEFVGRQAQLDVLNDWAAPADPHPILLFDAIGGSGKSMLSWEWTTRHATHVREDWAGRFWYSFYERGAIMADFCQRFLAYITGKSPDHFRRMKTPELGEHLLRYLQDRPWLFILDGLERLLVAYHRVDAAQVPDEEVNKPTDQIAHRDPCAAIRPDDDDLLRAFAAVAPSKLVITSRLVPRVLLNSSGQSIPGVLRVSLPGLRPSDAEALIRSCGVTGESQAIQNYLKSHCDCHPLVTGVLAGLVNDYLPDRGNFDAWADDPAGGGQLNLANLDLIQKRNHILKAALEAVPDKSRQLLSVLAILSEAVDYPTLSGLNPHLPPGPKEVVKPRKPETLRQWKRMPIEDRRLARQKYQAAVERRREYEQAVKAWRQLPEVIAAPQELANTVRDLERRGLLQYDGQTKRYDLHPVIRGITAGGLGQEEKERYGQQVVDHFSEQTHIPYEQAETLDDVSDGLHVFRTLIRMGRYENAYYVYEDGLAQALQYNLEANAEVLSLLRPFFPQGWDNLRHLTGYERGFVASCAAEALLSGGQPEQALMACGEHVRVFLQSKDWRNLRDALYTASVILSDLNRIAAEERCSLAEFNLASFIADDACMFLARFHRFTQLAETGRWTEAETLWHVLDPMDRPPYRGYFRSGDAEYWYARFRFWQDGLKEEYLVHAEQLAKKDKSRAVIRSLLGLRGQWRLDSGQWALAAESLHEAVHMARAVGTTDMEAETQLALAKLRLGQLPDPRCEAKQLAGARRPFHRGLADLWLAIGDHEEAKKHAGSAYKWAWADGEPHVHRYELNKARALLEKLEIEVPKLPSYDLAKYEKLPWEDSVADAIENLRAKKETAKRKKPKKRDTSNGAKGDSSTATSSLSVHGMQ
jgi:hypothetical protein